MTQSRPEIDETGTIEAQAHNRCPPRRSDADNLCSIGTPGKMCRPLLLSGMEQRRVTLGRGVLSCDKSSFEAVTAETG